MERGIVRELRGSKAFVEFKSQEACSTCSSKIICSPSAGSTRRVAAVNALGASIGDTVDVDESELSEIRMAFLQYGIPMIGFVTAVVGASLISPEVLASVPAPKELLWFTAGIAGLVFGGFAANRYAKYLADAGVPAFKIIHVLRDQTQ